MPRQTPRALCHYPFVYRLGELLDGLVEQDLYLFVVQPAPLLANPVEREPGQKACLQKRPIVRVKAL